MKIITNNELTFAQTTVTKLGDARVGLGAEKQRDFTPGLVSHLRAAKVHSIELNGSGVTRTTMERVYGVSPLAHPREAGSILLSYFLYQTWASQHAPASLLLHTMREKLVKIGTEIAELEAACPTFAGRTATKIFGAAYILLLHRIAEANATIGNVMVPYGAEPHGDMTLTNMIYDEGAKELVLIDFLYAPYLRSPIVDMSKVLQDVRLHWGAYTHDWKFPNSAYDALYETAFQPMEAAPWFPLVHLSLLIDVARILPYAVRKGDIKTLQWIDVKFAEQFSHETK